MLSKREKRIGIVAGVVLGALVLDQVMFTPLWTRYGEASQRVETAQRDLDAARRTFENDEHARRRWTEMAGRTLMTNAPDSEVQLLNRAREWADASRLSLQSLKPERSEREEGFQKITIRATAIGSMRQVAQFLYQVQSADIPVRISDIQLTARKENTDDLSVTIGLSTIYLPPDAGDTEVRR